MGEGVVGPKEKGKVGRVKKLGSTTISCGAIAAEGKGRKSKGGENFSLPEKGEGGL